MADPVSMHVLFSGGRVKMWPPLRWQRFLDCWTLFRKSMCMEWRFQVIKHGVLKKKIIKEFCLSKENVKFGWDNTEIIKRLELRVLTAEITVVNRAYFLSMSGKRLYLESIKGFWCEADRPIHLRWWENAATKWLTCINHQLWDSILVSNT